MVWYAWVMVVLFALNAVLTILMIGKPRQPVTPSLAVGAVVASALYIWAIVSLAT
jgi:predicted phosphoribosyltransferase